MTKLSKQDQRILDMALAQAEAGNYEAAQRGVQAFVRSAPTEAIHAKRKAAVTEAILLEASRAWQQSQSPSGVVASAELGTFLVAPSLHPTTRALLEPFRRMDVRI